MTAFQSGWYNCWCMTCGIANYLHCVVPARCKHCGEKLDMRLDKSDPSKFVTGESESGAEDLTNVQKQTKLRRNSIKYRYYCLVNHKDIHKLNALCDEGWIPCREILIDYRVLCVLMYDPTREES